ncbi:hypothetical protein [Kordia sp.]|uniref:hypothetical protein n=1 Tax=Kordia sp. TaxID=1965332 RepID=UPI003D296143
MKKIILLVLGIIVFGCASTHVITDEKLPPIQSCADITPIYDPEGKFDISELDNLDRLSYATTYTIIHTQTDSTERNTIRLEFADTGKRVVQKIFPKITMLDENVIQSKDYEYIMSATASVLQINNSSDAIEELLIPSPKSDKQLFIEVRTYVKEGAFKNSVRTYVFHTKKKELLYFDSVRYECDLRDEIMFRKVLNYSLEKLKKSID